MINGKNPPPFWVGAFGWVQDLKSETIAEKNQEEILKIFLCEIRFPLLLPSQSREWLRSSTE